MKNETFATILALFALGLASMQSTSAHGNSYWVNYYKPHVVATTSTLASIAQYVGGDKIVVNSLTAGKRDIHEGKVSETRIPVSI